MQKIIFLLAICFVSLQTHAQRIFQGITNLEGYQQYKKEISPIADSLNFYSEKIRQNMIPSERKIVNEKYHYFKKFYREKLTDFVTKNPNDEWAAIAILLSGFTQNKTDFPLADSLAQTLANKGIENKYAQYLLNEIDDIKNLTIRQKMVDFSLPDKDGKLYTFSQIKADKKLLVFWASWCSVCRGKNPWLLLLYNQYKNTGFEIISVSTDADKTKWLNASKADGINWINLWNSDGPANIAARKYAVSGLPQTFLFDAEGNLLGKNLSIEKIEKVLRGDGG